MTIEEITQRKAEIKALLTSEEEVDVEALRSEFNSLDEEEKRLAAMSEEAIEQRQIDAENEEIAKRREIANAIEEGSIRANEIPMEVRKMENVEIRNTVDYGKAFIRGFIKNDMTECRSLLSTNVEGGYVPVPEQLETEIKNAWETKELIGLVKKTSYKGNVKVGFELSSTGAVVHVEGTNAPEEEVLTLGVVELKAESVKKWITVSDEALDNATIDVLAYIYAEIAQRIAEKVEELILAKIVASPTTSNANAAAIAKMDADTLALDTIVKAVAMLGGKARDLHMVMNRQTRASLKALQMGANYNVDVFDGLEDRIVYTDALPSFGAATTGQTYIVIGDFGYGFQLNFPNGNEMNTITDFTSLAEKDLVKIVGRMFVGMGVVAPMSFVAIKKA